MGKKLIIKGADFSAVSVNALTYDDLTSSLSWTSGKYLNSCSASASFGNQTNSSAGTSVSNKVDISAYPYIIISIQSCEASTNTARGLVFYNSSNAPIFGVSHQLLGDVTAKMLIEVPEGAKYVSTTVYDTSAAVLYGITNLVRTNETVTGTTGYYTVAVPTDQDFGNNKSSSDSNSLAVNSTEIKGNWMIARMKSGYFSYTSSVTKRASSNGVGLYDSNNAIKYGIVPISGTTNIELVCGFELPSDAKYLKYTSSTTYTQLLGFFNV